MHSDPYGTTPPIVATSFAADDHWVAKRLGEPSVLDEELALAYCVGAGIGPEQCAGLARISEFRSIQSLQHPNLVSLGWQATEPYSPALLM